MNPLLNMFAHPKLIQGTGENSNKTYLTSAVARKAVAIPVYTSERLPDGTFTVFDNNCKQPIKCAPVNHDAVFNKYA